MDWSSRPARISRLKEKTHFDQVIMPLAYTAAAIAMLVLFWQGIELLEENKANEAYWIPALFFFLLPIPLILYRWLRKHYSRGLHA